MQFVFDDLQALIYEALINAYSILGLQKNATDDEIKKAYRMKALEFHPDRNRGKDTTADMVQVNVAKDILMNPQKRRQLDYELGGVSAYRQQAYTRPPEQQRTSGPWDPDWWGNRAWQASRNQYQQREQNSVFKRYYVKGTRFWQVEASGNVVTVEWGKIGFKGRTKQYTFNSNVIAVANARYLASTKEHRGYVQSVRPSQTSARPHSSPRQTSRRTSSSGPKSTYKIYGKIGNSPLHTRIKGRVFTPTGASRFRVGDRPSVSFKDKDYINVKNNDTGHTQSWKGESFVKLTDDILIEILLSDANINIV